MKALICQPEVIPKMIHLIRDRRVMLDFDLARLYQVKTKELNKAVKRNIRRFPADFMFRLKREEVELLGLELKASDVTSSLRFQFGTSKIGRGGRRYQISAYTEQGVAMLSSVLRSERAIQVNIAIMRVFVKIRHLLSETSVLAGKVHQIEETVEGHGRQITSIFGAIGRLTEPPLLPRGDGVLD